MLPHHRSSPQRDPGLRSAKVLTEVDDERLQCYFICIILMATWTDSFVLYCIILTATWMLRCYCLYCLYCLYYVLEENNEDSNAIALVRVCLRSQQFVSPILQLLLTPWILGPLRLELRFDDTAPPPQQSSTGPWTEVGQGAD